MLKDDEHSWGQLLQYPLSFVVLVKALFSGLSIDGENDAVIFMVAAMLDMLATSSAVPASIVNAEFFIYFLPHWQPGTLLH